MDEQVYMSHYIVAWRYAYRTMHFDLITEYDNVVESQIDDVMSVVFQYWVASHEMRKKDDVQHDDV